jgi:hypothetical protein
MECSKEVETLSEASSRDAHKRHTQALHASDKELEEIRDPRRGMR